MVSGCHPGRVVTGAGCLGDPLTCFFGEKELFIRVKLGNTSNFTVLAYLEVGLEEEEEQQQVESV